MDYAFNAHADEMLNRAMDELQDQLDSAEARFESDGSYLEIRSRYADCNDMSVLGDIIGESRRITDELYASYEALIRAANSIGKPLADEGVAPATLNRVVKFMKHINSECSTLGSNFSASINDYSLGNVASTRYSPSSEARMIETNWKLLHSLHPQVAEERKRAEEAAAKARAEREERERIERKRAQAEYPQKLAEWEVEHARVTKLREELISKEEERALARLHSKLGEERSGAIRKCKEEIARLQSRIDEQQRIIKGAKFLEFKKKVDASNAISLATRYLQGETSKLAEIESKSIYDVEGYERQKESALKEAKRRVEAENPLPSKPLDPSKRTGAFGGSAAMTSTQSANRGIKKAICETMLEYDRPMTISEIMEVCPEAGEISNQRVAALLRQLVVDGLVERHEEKHKTYFRAIDY